MSDPIQFEAFVRDYQNMVFTTAYRLLAEDMEAQDIAQEVFLKAYGCFDELSANPAAGGWLKVVTRNLCLNHLTRHRSRWRLFSELFSRKEEDVNVEELFAAPDALLPEFESAEQKAQLAEALAKLPAAQRAPLVLHYIEDMSYASIAQSLNMTLANVKINIHRGRLALRRVLSRRQDSGRTEL
jgi:RNA polymerase sigma-70 factor, ECF subfamily